MVKSKTLLRPVVATNGAAIKSTSYILSWKHTYNIKHKYVFLWKNGCFLSLPHRSPCQPFRSNCY
jgi:hypothetical protein